MKLTKYTHACITLEKDDSKLVIDPGSFSELKPALEKADAVLITHEHADHIDAATLETLQNGTIPVYGPDSIEGIEHVAPGDSFELAGFAVKVFGGQHALIHPMIPTIKNNAYFIDEEIFVPGDSFAVPPVNVKHLFVPLHAPWSKTSEVVDFTIAVKPEFAYNIHDSLLTEHGIAFATAHLKNLTKPFGVTYQHLAAGESKEL